MASVRSGHDGKKHYLTIRMVDSGRAHIRCERPKNQQPPKNTTIVFQADSPGELLDLVENFKAELDGAFHDVVVYVADAAGGGEQSGRA